ncbi:MULTISPECIES: PadR family transcriptional regulator [Paenibacillus]|uniref:PadR family transcriptional regulator n=1 Tax=Paenibacillus albilobatus TaxID=2716884 RepID=A0A919XK13_9BACL|nr:MULTISPECIES: helix-turn-helix transcriptional regulator [Paenibacillus]GIO32152.1 PadR family transcriptional regulator [Paenibacillus albilobatus]
MIEYIILGLLMEGDMSGYEMKKTIDLSVGMFYKASYGSLYPALKRMTEKEWVSVTEEEGSSKNKKIYSILPEGRIRFMQWLKEPLTLDRNEFLLRVFFYDYLDDETRRLRLHECRYNLNREIGRLQAVEEIVAGELAEIPDPQKHYFRVSVLSYGRHFFLMLKDYVDELLKGEESSHENNGQTGQP